MLLKSKFPLPFPTGIFSLLLHKAITEVHKRPICGMKRLNIRKGFPRSRSQSLHGANALRRSTQEGGYQERAEVRAEAATADDG